MPENQNPARVYGLSFVPRGQGRDVRFPPEIVVSISSSHVARCEKHLRNPLLYRKVPATEYLKEEEPFRFPDQGLLFPDLGSGVSRCGFRNCAYYVDTDDGREYHLPLVRKRCAELALTLSALLVAHNQGVYEEEEISEGSNRVQLIKLDTGCKTGGLHAHPAHGHVTPAMRQWLNRKARELPGEFCGFSGNKPMWPQVHAAIAETYLALTKSKYWKHDVRDCFGALTEDGRFLLHCPGNACDLAIYPDLAADKETEHPTRFSCHNLDAPEQQLALVAGLAALHDIAVKEIG